MKFYNPKGVHHRTAQNKNLYVRCGVTGSQQAWRTRDQKVVAMVVMPYSQVKSWSLDFILWLKNH